MIYSCFSTNKEYFQFQYQSINTKYSIVVYKVQITYKCSLCLQTYQLIIDYFGRCCMYLNVLTRAVIKHRYEQMVTSMLVTDVGDKM